MKNDINATVKRNPKLIKKDEFIHKFWELKMLCTQIAKASVIPSHTFI